MGKGSSETTTQGVSAEDAAAIRQGRQAGQATSGAALGIQEAGVDPSAGLAMGQYGDIYNQYADVFNYGQGMGQQGLDFAGQTGLNGLGAYANPYINMQIAGLDPLYAQQMGEAQAQAGDVATRAGAFGGSRSAVLQGGMQSDIMRNQAAQYGGIYAGGAAQAAQMMMQERQRMGQMGQYGMGLGLNALSGMGQTTGQQAQLGDYMRQREQAENERNYKNKAMAQQATQAGYGKDIESYQTMEKEGNLFNDMLGLGGMAASFLVPGAGMAAGGLSMLNQSGQNNQQQMAGFGSQYQGNPYSGMPMFNPQQMQGQVSPFFQGASLPSVGG